MAENDDGHGKLPFLSLEQKHAAMLSRLEANQDARLQKMAARKAECAEDVSPLESAQSFLQVFADGCRFVEDALTAIHQHQQQSSLRESENASIKLDLEKLSLRVSDLEKLVAGKTYFLPAYEVRASQATIVGLRDQIEAALAEILPKKKFAFKNKTAKKRASPEGAKNNAFQVTGTLHTNKVDTTKAGNEGGTLATRMGASTCSIRHLENSFIVKHLGEEDGEIVLEDLVGCKIYILGRSQALYGHKLKDCHVYAGPVTGSVLIEEAEDCLLMLASHQIRIHDAKNTDMYLRVRSRPIVEYTKGVRVAPYSFFYSGIDEDLRIANLLEETGQWQQVDDFRWLRAVPSPNWSVLPEHERMPPVDGTLVMSERR